jgi:hypothetical protein
VKNEKWAVLKPPIFVMLATYSLSIVFKRRWTSRISLVEKSGRLAKSFFNKKPSVINMKREYMSFMAVLLSFLLRERRLFSAKCSRDLMIEFNSFRLYTGFVETGKIGGGNMKVIRRLLLALGIILACIALSWVYTTVQLNIARSKGLYASAEQGMLAVIDDHYPPDRSAKILYAGTNSFQGRQPHIWYVIAEVRAASRADGSELGHNGCDAPGLFFLQTKDGWVFVPEGAFPGFMGFWMKVFDLAGPGQSTPSIEWSPDQNPRFCQ